MRLSTDQLVFWQHGFLTLNATIVYSWVLMLVLAAGAKLITRRLNPGIKISRWQCASEIIVIGIKKQIEEVGLRQPEKYLGFVGTLFLFIAVANIFTIFPGYEPPTGSLSTTAALALCVFVAVPFYGIKERGWGGYLKSYLEPTVIMLPFNIMGELSRTLALARPPVRQHDERYDDSGHPVHRHAFYLSHGDERARPADGHGPGLYFQHPGAGLHRRRHRPGKSENG